MTTPRRNAIIQTLEEYLWRNINALSSGYANTIADVKRNPSVPGMAFPAVYIMEQGDMVYEVAQLGYKGMSVIRKRRLDVILEMWLKPTEEAVASNELMAFYGDVRRALFHEDGGTLGGLCRMVEVGTSNVAWPKFGDEGGVIGMGMRIDVYYVDSPQETY